MVYISAPAIQHSALPPPHSTAQHSTAHHTIHNLQPRLLKTPISLPLFPSSLPSPLRRANKPSPPPPAPPSLPPSPPRQIRPSDLLRPRSPWRRRPAAGTGKPGRCCSATSPSRRCRGSTTTSARPAPPQTRWSRLSSSGRQ
jgi:hypothetical protein